MNGKSEKISSVPSPRERKDGPEVKTIGDLSAAFLRDFHRDQAELLNRISECSDLAELEELQKQLDSAFKSSVEIAANQAEYLRSKKLADTFLKTLADDLKFTPLIKDAEKDPETKEQLIETRKFFEERGIIPEEERKKAA